MPYLAIWCPLLSYTEKSLLPDVKQMLPPSCTSQSQNCKKPISFPYKLLSLRYFIRALENEQRQGRTHLDAQFVGRIQFSCSYRIKSTSLLLSFSWKPLSASRSHPVSFLFRLFQIGQFLQQTIKEILQHRVLAR